MIKIRASEKKNGITSFFTVPSYSSETEDNKDTNMHTL